MKSFTFFLHFFALLLFLTFLQKSEEEKKSVKVRKSKKNGCAFFYFNQSKLF
jgi:preprotein translocase subunit SecG